MKWVLRIIAIFVCIYLLEEYGGVDGTLIGILYLLAFVYTGYVIFRAFSRPRPPAAPPQFAPPAVQPKPAAPASTPGKRYKGLFIIALVVAALLLIRYIAVVSINLVLFMNRLLYVSEDTPPAATWALLGLFIGLVCGGFVAWKKYRLHFSLLLVPMAALFFFIGIMFLLNEPFKARPKIVAVSQDAFRFVTVQSSGHAAAYKTTSFADSNLVDGNPKTAWMENAKHAGIGESIVFTFDKVPETDKFRKFLLSGFHIVNGYPKTKKLWASYNRLREFRVLHNGITIGSYEAGDSFDQNAIVPVGPFPVKYNDVVTVQINSVYYGSTNNKQTAISELVPVVDVAE